jgi:hypothetical protein
MILELVIASALMATPESGPNVTYAPTNSTVYVGYEEISEPAWDSLINAGYRGRDDGAEALYVDAETLKLALHTDSDIEFYETNVELPNV